MEKDAKINSEEGIVYSQAIHYANRMVYMRIPLDASEKMPQPSPAPATGLFMFSEIVPHVNWIDSSISSALPIFVL